jgi:5-methyltetrahydropteroyltriglutamate--homocysteine methyltransferase
LSNNTLFPTSIAGSLPKPAWLSETNVLWPKWRSEGDELATAKRDATLLWIKEQEDAGVDILTDGEQSRQHFVHGFLEFVEGIDFDHKVKMGIRNNRYDAMVPVVTGPLKLKGRVHQTEARGDKQKLAMAFAELLNQEARALQADGVDIIQFDEPAFNVYMDDVKTWGVDALHRCIEGLTCATAVHICYGYGIKANLDWKETLGGEWRQYEAIFPALAASKIDQVSLECMNAKVPMHLMALLKGKTVMVGVIDVASDVIETPEQVAATIGKALEFVPRDKLIPCTNCGMAPMDRSIAQAKLAALGAGASLARTLYGN